MYYISRYRPGAGGASYSLSLGGLRYAARTMPTFLQPKVPRSLEYLAANMIPTTSLGTQVPSFSQETDA